VERNAAARRRFAAVRFCEQYMREHLDTRLTILDLSIACGMRSRSLINAFEAITGFGPADHLKRLRLSGVRRELQRADKSQVKVIDIAMDWGFWHMSHFAKDYRSHFAKDYRVMFGESPSQTLLQ
jgi:AraC family ethanolamine operon transcriptional activator